MRIIRFSAFHVSVTFGGGHILNFLLITSAVLLQLENYSVESNAKLTVFFSCSTSK